MPLPLSITATAALLAAPGLAPLVDPGQGPDADEPTLVALNPNISLRDCGGSGAAVTLGQTTGDIVRSGTFIGSAAPGEVFVVDETWLYCVGNYPPDAQICLTVVDAGSYIFELTEATIDPTLALVSGGAGLVCDDDTAGNLMSRIEWWLEPGTYELFVGAYALGGTGSFSMRISRAPW